MEHNEDELPINIGKEEFLVTRDNTLLYTFFGALATRDHVFIITGENTDEGTQGTYVFQHHDAFGSIASFLMEHEYPMILNQNRVPECDERAFQNSLDLMKVDVEDYIPDEWNK